MRKVKLAVDRLEQDKAVLLAMGSAEEIIFPRFFLPAGVSEGDILTFSIAASGTDTEKARAEAEELLKKLKNKK